MPVIHLLCRCFPFQFRKFFFHFQLYLLLPVKLYVVFGPKELLKFAREALLEHPDKDVRCLESLETVLRVKLNIGAPPQSGPLDPDGVGVAPWNMAIYCAGPDPSPALDLVAFVLDHKKRVGDLAAVPRLGLLTAPRSLNT